MSREELLKAWDLSKIRINALGEMTHGHQVIEVLTPEGQEVVEQALASLRGLVQENEQLRKALEEAISCFKGCDEEIYPAPDDMHEDAAAFIGDYDPDKPLREHVVLRAEADYLLLHKPLLAAFLRDKEFP